MKRFLLTIAYDGTGYHGWQVQSNALAVQPVIQDALEKLLEKRPDVSGCSRTDSGVHAAMYCLHFDSCKEIEPERVVYALNRILPSDISAVSCKEVASDFHARYSCKGKQYVYRIYNACQRNPFYDRYWYHYKYHLDEKKLNEAAKGFLGKHDFIGFCSSGGKTHDTVRTVTKFDVERDGDEIVFTVEADGFLYNMVRIMVGTLLFVAMGKIKPQDIPDIIDSKNRRRAGITAPAKGLTLNKIFY